MKKLMVSGVVCAVVAMAAAVGAQDKMGGMQKMDKMAAETSYTGCVARSEAGAFNLTNATAAGSKEPMAKDSMGKDALGKDAMGEDAMAKDGMKHDAMKNDAMKNGGMKDDAMAKDTMGKILALSSSAVDLSSHVGHRVTVTGVEGDKGTKDGLASFTVKSLKVVASSCS